MPAFVKGEDVRPCAGTCGRMTRRNKASAEKYPNTVSRASKDKCSACHTAETVAAKTPEQRAAEEEAKARVQAERIAAAHLARETIERQRRERQAKVGRTHLARQVAAQRGRVSA
jgi:hypothetical protein